MEKKVPLARWFSIILETIRAYVNRDLEGENIDHNEFSILMRIYMYGDGIKQEELTSSLVMDSAAISRSVKRLVSAALIRKEINPKDKRAYLIYLTPRGMEIEAKISEVYDTIFHRLTVGISHDDVYQCINTLEDIFENAQEMRRLL